MSLQDIEKVSTAANHGTITKTVSVSHTLVAGYKRLVVVAYTARKGDGGIGAATVKYGGVTCTQAATVYWEGDPDGDHRIAGIWYILEDNLPSDGSKTAQVTVLNNCELGIYVAQFRNVYQGGPVWTGADNVSPFQITAAVGRPTDVIFSAGLGTVQTRSIGDNQVVFGSWQGGCRHQASYDLTPDTPTDLQDLNLGSDGGMVTAVFKKAKTPVAARVFIMD